MTQVLPRPAPARPQALAGLRVVEIGFAAAGPLVGKYLANHGAEVIHVESRTAPDVFRTTYPPFKGDGSDPDGAAMFAFYNDGKRSVTLNLKQREGVAVARRLIARSDVLIESFPAGTMARRGLDQTSLRAESPRLIMLSSCNQGQTGPHAQHPGYGSQLTALAGFTHMLGEADASPVILYGPYIDYIAVGYGVIAVLAALARRERTGQGCYIDLSQFEAGLQFMTPALLEFQANGRVPARAGNRDAVAVPHGVYPCAGEDRWCALSVWDDDEWMRLRDALGDPAWAREEGLATARGRKERELELDARVAAWTRTLDRDAAVARLRAHGLRAAPVLSVAELFSDAQMVHRGFWRALPHPVLEVVHAMAPPFTLSATPARQERAGPLLGADNDYVFDELLGMDEAERERLAAAGAFD